MQRAENDCCRDCDYIVSILPCAKEHFIEHGMKPEKFVCIPNGIVKEDWERPQSEEPPVYRELFDGFKRDAISHRLYGRAWRGQCAGQLWRPVKAARRKD
ncbi:MAG: hypothetical protein ACLSB9_21035 [Hydrogeniiclostridium mannosilyticum]